MYKGKEMLEKEARKQGYTLSQLLKTEWVEQYLEKVWISFSR